MYIFALYKKNKHSMPRQKREKSGTGICHVMQGQESILIHCDEEYLVVTGKINIFALYNVNKHSMLRQKREKNGDFSNRSENRPLIQTHFIGDKTICVVLLSGFFGYLAENNYFCGKLNKIT